MIAPKHIPADCKLCNTPLQLLDLIKNPDCPEEDIWYDEFGCPICKDGIHLDWPQSEFDELDRRVKEAEDHPETLIPWDEVKKRLECLK